MNTLTQTLKFPKIMNSRLLKISSAAFQPGGFIPVKYTCEGRNINPPIDINSIPEATKSLAIVMVDAAAPEKPWCHWVMWNIPVSNHIMDNFKAGREGLNDYNKYGYDGPCMSNPSHRYSIKVYALDCILVIPRSTDKKDLENAIRLHVIASGELVAYCPNRVNYKYHLL